MEFLVIISVVLVSFVSGNKEACTENECARYCPDGLPSEGSMFGQRKEISVSPVAGVQSKNCLCQCAVPEFEDCDEDGDCASGFVCGARKDVGDRISEKGSCTSKCRFYPCGPEETCAIIEGERKCLCKTYECAGQSDPRFPNVCAEDSSNTMRIFANECAFRTENCQEKTANRALLRRLATCPGS